MLNTIKHGKQYKLWSFSSCSFHQSHATTNLSLCSIKFSNHATSSLSLHSIMFSCTIYFNCNVLLHFNYEDGGSTFILYVNMQLPEYTAGARRPQEKSSAPWKSHISNSIYVVPLNSVQDSLHKAYTIKVLYILIFVFCYSDMNGCQTFPKLNLHWTYSWMQHWFIYCHTQISTEDLLLSIIISWFHPTLLSYQNV